MVNDYKLGSIVMMKKPHPCGKNEWEIVRVGADIKIKCLECGRSIMMPNLAKKILIRLKVWLFI